MRRLTSTLISLSAIAGGSFAASVAQAEETPSGFMITPGVGYYQFDDDRRLDANPLMSLGLGYQFDSPWAVELLYLRANTDIERTDFSVDHDQFRLDGYYNFARSGKWQPYLAAGVGQADFDAGNIGQYDDDLVDFGGGFRYFLSEHVALRTDLRGVYGDEFEDVDAALTFGLNFILGGSSSSKPVASKPAPTPPPAPAAPVDSDNDGVVDGKDQCPSTPAGVAVDSVGCALDTDGDGVADYKDECPDSAKGAKVDAKGCYLELLEDKEVRLNVKFANNSVVVPEQYMAEVEAVADFLRSYATTDVVIEGHTDDRGSAAYNQALSERRAKSVAAVLISRFGIEADRVSAVGYGEEDPMATNDTEEGRALNRRVVAVVKATVKTIQQ